MPIKSDNIWGPTLKKREEKTLIYVLQSRDEMRHPYESALLKLCNKVVWFSSYDSMLNASDRDEPSTVIVDLDCLLQPIDSQLTQLRALFAASDLIALSSADSAQAALLCIRSGFADFLIKPASPEELAWGVRKCQQKHELLSRLKDPKTAMVRAVTQISTCTARALVQLCSLEYLQQLFHSEGAAWLAMDERGMEFARVVCSIPKRIAPSKILFDLPHEKISGHTPTIVRGKADEHRKLVFPCSDFPKSAIFLWGIQKRITVRILSNTRLLLEHSHLCLLNLQKFDEIKQQTFIDDLTGMYNSRYLKYAITNAILKCKDPGQSFSVLFIDVDHFKHINDQYGHLVGSEFLIAIARTIKNAVRSIDPVFRYGGDEFVVILQTTDVAGAKEIAERIRKNIERRMFVMKGQRIQTTVSIGIATYPQHATERETLLKLADEAMYSVKRASRNAVHLAEGLQNHKMR